MSLQKKVCIVVILVGIAVSNKLIAQNLESISKQKPFTITGSLSARSILYTANGIANRRTPFSYMLNGSPTITLYNAIVIPLSFTYSEQDRVFRQPFNQFGMSPYYKWIKVHAGYRNISFSQFTLAGHTFLGGGVELNPGILRLGFVYGRFNRATPFDSTSRAYQPFTYENLGYAGKVGIGKGNNFFDVSFVKAWDVANSVAVPVKYQGSVTPAENLVVGINSQVKFLKKITFSVEASTSIYTKNTSLGAPLPEKEQDAVINSFKSFMIINTSTERYSALQTSLAYQEKKFSLKVQYRRVDPGYRSMGAYFFNNDVENITLAPSVTLFKGKLKMGGSFGLQHDNLKGQKQATSNRVIGSANLSAELNQHLGIDFNYSNYSNTQLRRTILLKDSFRIAQVSQNFSLTPRYILANEKRVHSIVLSANYNVFSSVDNLSDTKTYNFFLNYQVTLVPRNLTLMTNFNYTEIDGAGFKQGNYGTTLGISKTMLNGKLSVGWNGSFLTGLFKTATGLILNQNGNLNYKVDKHHSMGVAINYINNTSQQIEYTPSYSEWKGDINYRYIF
jgi:hypothetical protein